MTIRVTAQVGGFLSSTTNPWSIGLQFLATADMTSAECLLAANAAMTALASSTAFKAGLSSNRNVQSIRIAVHNPATGVETSAAVSTAAAVSGTSTAVSIPPQVAVVLTLRTATPGRSHRGRVYYPVKSSAADGSVAGADKTLYAASLNALVDQIEIACAAQGSNLAWVVWSKALGIGTAVNLISIGSRCDTQRRRNDGADTYTSFSVT